MPARETRRKRRPRSRSAIAAPVYGPLPITHPEFDAMAKWYDFDYERRMRHDLRFYRGCVEEGGDPVLELGVGTGRIAAHLAKAGYTVTGVDLSAEMLAKAEARVARLGRAAAKRIRLVHGDMAELADLPVKGRFRTVLVPFRSFHHLYTVDRQLAALRAVRRRLAPDGLVVIDLLHPNLPEFAEMSGKLQRSYERRHPKTGHKIVQRFRLTCDVPRQLAFIDYFWDEYRGTRRLGRDHAPMRWRWFHRYEFEHLLARAGLRTLRLYGGFDHRLYDEHAEEMIFLVGRDS